MRTQTQRDHNNQHLSPAMADEILHAAILIRGGVNVIDCYKYSQTLGAGQKELDPEAHLMLAVFQEAYDSVTMIPYSLRTRRLYAEALEWFTAEESDWIFSFHSICAGLKWDPSFVKSGVLKTVQSKQRKGRTNERRLGR